jgi:hypothetical protein
MSSVLPQVHFRSEECSVLNKTHLETNNWHQVTEYTKEGRLTFAHAGICGNSTGFVQTPVNSFRVPSILRHIQYCDTH